jgi:hypothetical protein
MATSTQLFMQVASSTGQLVADSIPAIYLYTGLTFAFAFAGVIIVAVVRSFAKVVR